MTEQTSFLNLTKPGGGSTGTNTPPDRVDIDVLNDNFDKIDAGVAAWGLVSARNQQFYGSTAAIGSVTGMKRGDTYQENNGSFRKWTYDGSNWVLPSEGMFLIRPGSTSGSGVTIESDGSVSHDNPSNFGINDIFSSAYKRYKFLWEINGVTAASGIPAIRLRSSGTSISSSDYQLATVANSAATPVATEDINTSSWQLSTVGMLNHSTVVQCTTEFLITGPTESRHPTILGQSMLRASGSDVRVANFAGLLNLSTGADGMTFFSSPSVGMRGRVRVWGLA